jgi:hypothetical protein
VRPVTSLRFGCGMTIIASLLVLPLLSLPLVQWLGTLAPFEQFVVIVSGCVALLVTLLYLSWKP